MIPLLVAQETAIPEVLLRYCDISLIVDSSILGINNNNNEDLDAECRVIVQQLSSACQGACRDVMVGCLVFHFSFLQTYFLYFGTSSGIFQKSSL